MSGEILKDRCAAYVAVAAGACTGACVKVGIRTEPYVESEAGVEPYVESYVRGGHDGTR